MAAQSVRARVIEADRNMVVRKRSLQGDRGNRRKELREIQTGQRGGVDFLENPQPLAPDQSAPAGWYCLPLPAPSPRPHPFQEIEVSRGKHQRHLCGPETGTPPFPVGVLQRNKVCVSRAEPLLKLFFQSGRTLSRISPARHGSGFLGSGFPPGAGPTGFRGSESSDRAHKPRWRGNRPGPGR